MDACNSVRFCRNDADAKAYRSRPSGDDPDAFVKARADAAVRRFLDFLARLAFDWEQAAFRAKDYGVRVIICRFGIVMGK
jgi:hypothetical protein